MYFLHFANVELGSRVSCVQNVLITHKRIVCSQCQLCRSVIVTCCEGFYLHPVVFSTEAPSGVTEVIDAYSASKSKALRGQPPGRAWSFEHDASAV